MAPISLASIYSLSTNIFFIASTIHDDPCLGSVTQLKCGLFGYRFSHLGKTLVVL